MERSFFDEDFDVEISATPEKVDIKSKGDEAKEIEEFARCVLGDNFSFFDAFDDDDESAEDVDDVEVEDTGEEDFVDLGDEDDAEEDDEEISGEDAAADLFDNEDEEDVDVKEGLIPSLGDIPSPPMPNLAEKKEKINELFNIDAGINIATDKKTNGIELEEGDLNINLDAHELGGTGNNVDVLSKPDFNKNLEEAFQSWYRRKKLVEGNIGQWHGDYVENPDDYWEEQSEIRAATSDEIQALINKEEVGEDPLGIKELYEKRCKGGSCKSEVEQVLDEAGFSKDGSIATPEAAKTKLKSFLNDLEEDMEPKLDDGKESGSDWSGVVVANKEVAEEELPIHK